VAVRLSSQASGGIDRTAKIAIRIWDTTTGVPLDHVQPPDGQLPGGFSPDNRLFVTTSAQGTILVWDLASGRERISLRGHLPGNVRAVLFTADHRFLFSGGDDSQVLLWDLTGRAGDGVWRTVKHPPARQLELWDKLAGNDSAAAHKAIWELAADPVGTVAFLEARLKPVTGPGDKEIAALIAQLGSDRFAKRQEAQTLLAKIGEPAVPALREALAKNPSLEQARRLEKLIQELASPAPAGEPLRALRALEILERIATPEARQVLSSLGQGLPGSRFTRTAKEALQRLKAP
jgi:hypothetical protein